MKDEVLKEAADFIAEFEGFVATPYLCPAGVWTIGYGTTKGVTKDTKPINKQEAKILLARDLEEANKTINSAVKPLISRNQKIALLSLVYNIGSGNFKTSTLLRKINAKDFPGAADQFKKWVYAGGKVLEGLKRRREAEASLFLQPVEDERVA